MAPQHDIRRALPSFPVEATFTWCCLLLRIQSNSRRNFRHHKLFSKSTFDTMQITQRARPCLAQSRARVQSRRPSTKVMAWAGDNSPFAGLLRMFAPAKYLNTKDDYPENTGFTGTISRGRKPFKDGFIVRQPTTQQYVEAAAPEKAVQGQESEGMFNYLNDAAERVVGHNFTGDETEPDWSKTGHKGWKGDRRSKHADGFHSIKM